MTARPVIHRIQPVGTKNAAIVRHAIEMHGNPDSARVFDLTPGRGKWWDEWSPLHITSLPAGRDFTTSSDVLECAQGRYDIVAFDPPYVAQGGVATTTAMAEHLDRYGRDTGKSGTQLAPEEVTRLAEGGMRTATRLVKERGLILQKCADYVTGGRMRWGTHDARVFGRSLGLTQVDESVLQSRSPQPSGRVQRHARVGSSVLLVWRREWADA